jgi:probable HAF family extracellular repeat protein
MTDLGTLPGATRSLAWGINNRGQIVGGSGPGFDSHAVLWQNGSILELGTLGGTFATAYGINDPGQVVGVSETADGEWHVIVVNTRPGNVSQAASVTPVQPSLYRAETPRTVERPAALERHLLRCGTRAVDVSLGGEVSLGRCGS